MVLCVLPIPVDACYRVISIIVTRIKALAPMPVAGSTKPMTAISRMMRLRKLISMRFPPCRSNHFLTAAVSKDIHWPSRFI